MSSLYPLLTVFEVLFYAVLSALLFRGPFRRHITFSIYVAATFCVDVIENVTYYRLGWRSTGYYRVYWTDRIVLALLLFAVVIAFTYQAVRESRFRPAASRALIVITAVALILPFAFLPNHHSKAHGAFSSQWFNHATQILNFGAAIMNLVLWTGLLSNRRRDPELVTLSIGIGIVTTSAAIVWGARQWLAESSRWPLDSFMYLANLGAIVLWCWLFWPKARKPNKAVPPNAPPDALTTAS